MSKDQPTVEIVDVEGGSAPKPVADGSPIETIEIDDPLPHPADVPPIVDNEGDAALGMRTSKRSRSRSSRMLLGLLAAILGIYVTASTWSFTVALVESNPVLGWVFGAMLAALVLGIAWSEVVGYRRLRKVTRLQQQYVEAVESGSPKKAKRFVRKVALMYRKHSQIEIKGVIDEVVEKVSNEVDSEAILAIAESQILQPLDELAELEVERTVRHVATVTAILPAPSLDVLSALIMNFMMIRRVAEIYCGRPGAMGSWRLLRRVVKHLVATAAVSLVGDSLAGSWLGKLVGRVGEGAINGVLTARVGLTAIDVCRPMPFGNNRSRPNVRGMLLRAVPDFRKEGPETGSKES